MTMMPEIVPSGFVAVTPSDATIFAPALMGIFVAVGGTSLTVVDSLGVTSTFTNWPDKTVLWGRIVQVLDTGTDSTGVVGYVA